MLISWFCIAYCIFDGMLHIAFWNIYRYLIIFQSWSIFKNRSLLVSLNKHAVVLLLWTKLLLWGWSVVIWILAQSLEGTCSTCSTPMRANRLKPLVYHYNLMVLSKSWLHLYWGNDGVKDNCSTNSLLKMLIAETRHREVYLVIHWLNWTGLWVKSCSN